MFGQKCLQMHPLSTVLINDREQNVGRQTGAKHSQYAFRLCNRIRRSSSQPAFPYHSSLSYFPLSSLLPFLCSSCFKVFKGSEPEGCFICLESFRKFTEKWEWGWSLLGSVVGARSAQPEGFGASRDCGVWLWSVRQLEAIESLSKEEILPSLPFRTVTY